METIIYPLLYYHLEDKSILGILVGTDFRAVDKDLRGIKATLSDFLQKQYKKYDEYPYVGIKEPRLKVIEVKVRPAYRERTGSYPFSHTIKVPVVTVYGPNGRGFFECHIPTFNESFYYYNAKEYHSLATHFAANILNNMSPDELNRLFLHGKPELDTVTLRVNYRRDYSKNPVYEDIYPVLTRLAEQYPYSKAIRKNVSTFPEAAWELEDKVIQVIDKIQKTRSNVLVIGNSGVGKSSVLKQAIRKMDTQNRKQQIKQTFWQIMPQRITASSKYLGEWQEAVEELVEDLNSANGILWVVDFVRLLQIGGEGPEDSVASFMISFLQQGKLQLVGEATPQELDSIKRLLPGFVENFQVITIEELPETKIQTILDKVADFSRQNLEITLEKSAVELAYRLLLRYFPYESFPGKAVKFLSRCVSEAQMNDADSISKTDVINNFVKQTGMPELFLRDDLLLDTSDLVTFFENRIIGQTAAVDQMASVVKIFKAGLNNPYKPIITMIYAGPTGVGKTASAKALAEYFFGKGQKQNPLIRIDMSEFQHPSQINRFIGAGREVGKLVQDIRERPFSVLLLDEVEKADPSVFDALLTVLDEGILVDAFGRITNFRNTIIIMTTNLGASNRKSIGFSESDSPKYQSAINAFFRPEFVNRIDSVVMFNALNAENIREITAKELDEVKLREGFVKKGLKLKFTKQLSDHIASAGFDERYGARPLQRAIEEEVIAPLARWLLDNPKIKNCELTIDFDKTLLVSKV
ncbi:MAG: AAA family ATPase [Bacteroidota bacterium]